MLLLISDANILIDMEAGGLLASMFSLGCRIAVPDLLYADELEHRNVNYLALGLSQMSLTGAEMQEMQTLAARYPRAGRNDLSALVLARREQCPLVTGDFALRQAAEAEQVVIRGTLWLVQEMVQQQKISVAVAREAYARMQITGRRLPWEEAEAGLLAVERSMNRTP